MSTLELDPGDLVIVISDGLASQITLGELIETVVRDAEPDSLEVPGLRKKVKELGRNYGRASETIHQLRNEVAALKSRVPIDYALDYSTKGDL